MNSVIPLYRTGKESYEILVLEADSSDSTMQAVQALRDGKAVILKLHNLDNEQAQRQLDFLSGSAYAISSHPLKIGRAVFLFTPHTIQIQTTTDQAWAIR